MNQVTPIPTRAMAEAAWEEYRLLVVACLDDASLRADRPHCESMARAYKRWLDLFMAVA